MVSVLASSVVDHGFKPWSGQTKDYKIGICCFSAKHAALRRKSKDWLAWNQDNVSEWGDMSIHRHVDLVLRLSDGTSGKIRDSQTCRYDGQFYFHWYNILGLLYERALVDLQIVHNLF
jgi:hypothetical protein